MVASSANSAVTRRALGLNRKMKPRSPMMADVPSARPISGWPMIVRVRRRYSLFVSVHAIHCRHQRWSASENARYSARSRAGTRSITLFQPAIAIDEMTEYFQPRWSQSRARNRVSTTPRSRVVSDGMRSVSSLRDVWCVM